MARNRSARVFAIAAVLGLIAAACSNKTPSGTPSSSATTGKTGGSIVAGAEQWADCMNPITSCSSGFWQTMMNWLVLPRLVTYDNSGNMAPSPLITEVPTLQNGGLATKPDFHVTFHLNPSAVWAPDGTPITSKDVDFTWKANMNTKGAYNTVGYDQITKIDTTDPKTVVIHFKNIYVDWEDLFGGNGFGILEAAKTPFKGTAAKPDLSKWLATGPMPYSGTQWIQTSFTNTQLVFARNDKFWGQKALLDKMTWVPEKDQATEVADLLSGNIVAAFPQPSNVSIVNQLKPNPNAKSVGGTGNFYEALWLNNQDPVLKDDKVREALFYAIDRNEILTGLIHLNAPNEQLLNCGPFALNGRGPWCSGATPWDKYSYQPDMAKQILTADGYDCSKVPASPCTKGGKSLTLNYRYCNGNARRGTTFDLIKDKVKAAGFAFSHSAQGNDCAAPLFTQTLPHGNFQVGDYAQGPIAFDPSPTSNLACSAIPTAKNQYGGANFSRFCDPQVDSLMRKADTELDLTQRQATLKQAWQIMADKHAFLPIYNLPNVTMWRSDKVAGPIGDANGNPLGTWQNAYQWSVV